MIHLPSVILASSSPRRRQLLAQIGVRFTVISPDTDETQLPDESPQQMVQRLAQLKARAVASQQTHGLVLGADTTVVLNNVVLGKPTAPADAHRMLQSLSGNTHTVLTGWAIIDAATGAEAVGCGNANVTFRTLDDDEIAAYVATGSPMDKAGSYGIQDDLGAVFIQRIDGDYYTVVGLPLAQVYCALRDMAHEEFEE
ncbi:MAG: septum formation inhibitor Maf [Armatimonadetes bacterium]|nr:septum formation inhibitor Maf [Armatimonadota bacterium]